MPRHCLLSLLISLLLGTPLLGADEVQVGTEAQAPPPATPIQTMASARQIFQERSLRKALRSRFQKTRDLFREARGRFQKLAAENRSRYRKARRASRERTRFRFRTTPSPGASTPDSPTESPTSTPAFGMRSATPPSWSGTASFSP